MRRFYVGSYANPFDAGIYEMTLDSNGQIELVHCYAWQLNPSFLVVAALEPVIYAVNESLDTAGSVEALRHGAGALLGQGRHSTSGAAPCHLAISLRHRMLMVANYTGGSVFSYALQNDGNIGDPLQFIQHDGSSVHADRQTSAHPHAVVFDPAQDFVFVPDLGCDAIFQYRIDAATRLLSLHQKIDVSPGSGPRHMVFHPHGTWAYLVNELANTVQVFFYEQGSLRVVQTINTLPVSETFDSTCAEIEISADGRFLYVSNRGHDSLAVFAVSAEGSLSLIEHVPTQGKTPRHFALTPDGQFLLVANQDSNQLNVFKVSDEGRLSALSQYNGIHQPSCICFA